MKTQHEAYTIILITLNVVSLLVIFWLIYFIFDHFDKTPLHDHRYQQHVATQPPAPAASNNSVTQNTGRTTQTKDIESRISHAIDKFKSRVEQDVFASTPASGEDADKRLTHLQRTRFDVEQSIKALRKLAEDDVVYLQQYKLMKAAEAAHKAASLTAQQAQKIQVSESANTDVDHLNKIDVSQAGNPEGFDKAQKLASQLRQLIAEQENGRNNKVLISELERQYIAAPKPAAGERRNQMRTIRVRRGDTLWKIAIRAYGTGFAYPRIFEANPQLSNPDDLVAGEILRVPL